jgi:dephospho-CoA kinase
MPKKLKIAITGGIGAGKSEVLKIYADAGYPVLYADEIAKKLLNSNKFIRERIISEFGAQAYNDNQPDKKFLAEQVFGNPENVLAINNIIHPETFKVITSSMESLLKESEVVFVESALIFESKREEMFDYIIHVFAGEHLRIKRASERLGISQGEVMERMTHQMPEEKKRELADFVIVNDKNLSDLETKSKFILNLILSISG